MTLSWSFLRRNKILVLILIISLLAGLIVITYTGLTALNFGDAIDYLKAAEAIQNKLPYPRESRQEFFRAPGYPFVITAIWEITGISGVPILKIFNVLFHVGSTYLVIKISKTELSQKVSLFCAFLYALNPFSLYQLSGIATEPLITLVFLAFFYLITRKPTSLNIFLLTITSISCVAIRPEYIFPIVLLILAKILWNWRRRESVVQCLVVLISLTLALSLWGYSNKKATGDYILLTDATNWQLWFGSTDVMFRNYPFSTPKHTDFNFEQLNSLRSQMQVFKSRWGDKYALGSPNEKSDFWGVAFTERVHSIGIVNYAKAIFIKGVIFWRPFLSPASYGEKLFILSLFVFLPLTIFTAMGIIFYWRRNKFKPSILIFCVTLSMLTIVHAFQMPDLRFRIPVFMPFASIMAGAFTW